MKRMIYVPNSGKRNGAVNYPKPNEEVMVSQCSVYSYAYDVVGYEYGKDGRPQSIAKYLFVDPLDTKEIAEEYIEVIEKPLKREEVLS